MSYDQDIEIVTCRRCGTVAEGSGGSIPLTWSSTLVDDRIDALCERCTRDHVRDIEGKLDEGWWG